MGIKAVEWATDVDWLKPQRVAKMEATDKAVLIAIARCVPDGVDYPTDIPIGLLARRTSLSERSVRRSLRELEALGLIQTTYKRQTCGLNAIRLMMPSEAAT